MCNLFDSNRSLQDRGRGWGEFKCKKQESGMGKGRHFKDTYLTVSVLPALCISETITAYKIRRKESNAKKNEKW
jgi:hypothetical protein